MYKRQAGHRVVGGLTGDDALRRALAVQLWVLGGALGLVVGHPGGDGRTGAGDRADDRADEAGFEPVSYTHLCRLGRNDVISINAD